MKELIDNQILRQVEKAKSYFYHQHDVFCNQKYGGGLLYSFHLEAVYKQGLKFRSLLNDDEVLYCLLACLGHDSIEDARITYNDVKNRFGYRVADIVILCTDLRGKTREERHSEEFHLALVSDKLATYVKLCDIIANVKFSILTDSSMYLTYKREFSVNRKYYETWSELTPMLDHLEKLFNLD